MKLLAQQSNGSASETECADQLLATVPSIMRTIRKEMRSRRPAALSVPQFRTMALLHHHRGASLSHIAEHIGLALPTMSRMIDTLVKRGFVMREASPDDRRRVTLVLTKQGRAAFDAARTETRIRLVEKMKALSPSEREEIMRALKLLRGVFAPAPKNGCAAEDT